MSEIYVVGKTRYEDLTETDQRNHDWVTSQFSIVVDLASV